MTKRKYSNWQIGFVVLVIATAIGISVKLAVSRPRHEAPRSSSPPANDLTSTSWSSYRNVELGITFEYPKAEYGRSLSETELEPSTRNGVATSGGVTIHRDDGYGLISVAVQHPPFTTLEEWLKWRTDQVGYPIFKEGKTTIDGVQALITHTPQEAGAPLPSEDTRERTTVFFKKGTLYQIVTRGIPYGDVQRIWNGFETI